MVGVYVFGDIRDWFDFGIGGSMNRFDEEAKTLIAEIMMDCSFPAADKIASWGRRIAFPRDVEIAALREKLTQVQHDLDGAQALEAQNVAALQSANAELAILRPVVEAAKHLAGLRGDATEGDRMDLRKALAAAEEDEMSTARLSEGQLLQIGENAMKQSTGLDWDLDLRSRHELALALDSLRDLEWAGG